MTEARTNPPRPETPAPIPPALPGARPALVLLLGINLFNYVDRYVLAAAEPAIRKSFFRPDDPNAKMWMGYLATAFIVSYAVTAPLFGWLADRMSRWLLVGASVLLWTVATGAGGLTRASAPAHGFAVNAAGLAGGFVALLVMRLFVGVGEAGYGPAAPTIISDLYPVARRGAVLAWFYAALPVGSAIGYVLGGQVAQHFGWQRAFFVVVPPGILLGIVCFFMKEPPRGKADRAAEGPGGVARKARARDYLVLLKTLSYVLNCLGMAAMTFAIGGVSYWMPDYLVEQPGAGNLGFVNTAFGGILASAGLLATLAGGWAGDKLKPRLPSSYFLVSGVAILLASPLILVMIHTPFPYAWGVIFLVVFLLFFNTGPSNTALANVTHPSVRATAFALNILVIHALGDVPAPPLLGRIQGFYSWEAVFRLVAAVTALAGVMWLWGCRYLAADTAAAPRRL